jgi:hypothetical protein
MQKLQKMHIQNFFECKKCTQFFSIMKHTKNAKQITQYCRVLPVLLPAPYRGKNAKYANKNCKKHTKIPKNPKTDYLEYNLSVHERLSTFSWPMYAVNVHMTTLMMMSVICSCRNKNRSRSPHVPLLTPLPSSFPQKTPIWSYSSQTQPNNGDQSPPQPDNNGYAVGDGARESVTRTGPGQTLDLYYTPDTVQLHRGRPVTTGRPLSLASSRTSNQTTTCHR